MYACRAMCLLISLCVYAINGHVDNRQGTKPSDNSQQQIGVSQNGGGTSRAVQQPYHDEHQEAADPQQYDPSRDTLYRWYLLATIIGVVGAWALLVVVLKQSKAVTNAERAWIVPDPETPVAYEPDKIIRFVCRLRNTGKTPARIIEIAERPYAASQSNPLPRKPEYFPANVRPAPAKGGAILAPGASMPRFFYAYPDDMKKVEQGEFTLYIYGSVVYRDVFRKKHLTQYCFRLNIPRGGADPVTRDFFMDESPGYNEAT